MLGDRVMVQVGNTYKMAILRLGTYTYSMLL